MSSTEPIVIGRSDLQPGTTYTFCFLACKKREALEWAETDENIRLPTLDSEKENKKGKS